MKTVAVFDFDNTLITGDSFMPFLCHAAGTIPTYAALFSAIAIFSLRKPTDNLRTAIKAFLLDRLLKGKKIADLSNAAAQIRRWQKINDPIMQNLREHHAKGDTIVIASGGLDLYLPELLRDIPHDALICTDIGVENGIVTGQMINGNCVRQCKAERVAAWLAANGPFDETFGYGNYPHDVPMLNLVHHRIIVS
jgi:HAD superfamily hydrolase (TIGR01490 family)